MTDKRAYPPADKKTVRDRVILWLIERFGPGNVTEPVHFDPDNPSLGPLFDFSKRGELEDISFQETPACAISEGDEEGGLNYWPYVDKKFRIYINFKVVKEVGVDVYSLINYYFGRLEQELVRPEIDGLHIADDLTMSVETAGNSIQYNGDSDPEPGGTSMFDIEIRHVLGDPFTEKADG